MSSAFRSRFAAPLLVSLLVTPGVHAVGLAGCGNGGSGTGGSGGTGGVGSTSTGKGTTVASGPSGNATATASTGVGPYCGDGNVDPGEVCDTAGISATCNADCTASMCGDGKLNTLAGEECDDGNTATGDACGPDCKPTVFALTDQLPAASQLYEQARVIGTGSSFLVVHSRIELDGSRTLVRTAWGPKGTVTVPSSTLANGNVTLPSLAADGAGAGLILWGATNELDGVHFANGGGLGASLAPVAFPNFAPASTIATDSGGFCTISLGGDTRCETANNWGPIHNVSPYQASNPFGNAVLALHTGGILADYLYSADNSERATPLDASATPSGSETVVSAAGSNPGPQGVITHADGSFVVLGLVGGASPHAVFRPYGADGTLDGANVHDIPVPDIDLSVVGSPSGEFVIAYRILTQTPPTYTCSVALQVYSAAGQAMGAARTLSTPPTFVCDRWPRVARSQAGDVLVTWQREVTSSLPSPAKFEAILLPGLLPP
jgi:cysteine-rich repeat protein